MSTSFFLPFEASSSRIYSMIFFFGSKGYNSSNPNDLTAILISSLSDTPVERCCLRRKYRPASNIAFNGSTPTSSEPVTRMPRSAALRQTSSKASCMEVTEISVRFIEIWAIPYSSINQPIAFTDFRLPGIITGFPFSSNTFLPVIGLPSRFTLPRSRTSKAIELARRVEVVFRLTL